MKILILFILLMTVSGCSRKSENVEDSKLQQSFEYSVRIYESIELPAFREKYCIPLSKFLIKNKLGSVSGVSSSILSLDCDNGISGWEVDFVISNPCTIKLIQQKLIDMKVSKFEIIKYSEDNIRSVYLVPD